MSFDKDDPRLTAYALDEADADERAAIDEAVNADPELRDAVNGLLAASRAIADTIGNNVGEENSLHTAQTLRIEARAKRLGPRKRLWARRRFVYGSLAAAAALLVCTLVLKGNVDQHGLRRSAESARLETKAVALATKTAPTTIIRSAPADQQDSDAIVPQKRQITINLSGESAQPEPAAAPAPSNPLENLDEFQVATGGNSASKVRGGEPPNPTGGGLQNVQVGGAIRLRTEFDADPNVQSRQFEQRAIDAQNSNGIVYHDRNLPAVSDEKGIRVLDEAGRPKLDYGYGGGGYGGGGFGGGGFGGGGLGGGGEHRAQDYRRGTNGQQNVQTGGSLRVEHNYYDRYVPDNGAPGLQQLSTLWGDSINAPADAARTEVSVDINGGGIAEQVPIYTKPDGTSVLALIVPQPSLHATAESYEPIVENPFVQVKQEPLSTFGLDVDTASYANTRRFLSSGQLPPPNAVRVEEFVNAFVYEYPAPTDGQPIAVRGDIAGCPWNSLHRLARIAVKAKEIPFEEQPPLRLTFLIDVSGSMGDANKLALLRESMKALARKMRPTDQVAICTYRDTAQCALGPTPGTNVETICATIDTLRAEGSTNGAGGIEVAYATADQQFLGGGLNRVILATDGDFNVGETENAALVQRIAEHAKSGVFLTVLGFGVDNLKDDRLEGLADKGNGNYYYIDSFAEANKVLVDRMAGTIAVAAKDAKIQVEFNPAKISAYRLLGYENRALAAQDFNDDRKDAGDLGAGHTVTALYELVPVGVPVGAPGVDALKYQSVPRSQAVPRDQYVPEENAETMNIKLRYKEPNASESKRIDVPVVDAGTTLDAAGGDFRFASAAAAFAMLLRNSCYAGNATLDSVQRIAESAANGVAERTELVSLVVQAKTLRQNK